MLVKLFAVCESAALDSRSNTISLFHLFEEVNAAGFPILVQKLAIVLVSQERMTTSSLEMRTRITLGADELFNGPFNIVFQETPRHRTIIDLNGLIVPGPGDLVFELNHMGARVTAWTTIVRGNVPVPNMVIYQPQAPPQLAEA